MDSDLKWETCAECEPLIARLEAETILAASKMHSIEQANIDSINAERSRLQKALNAHRREAGHKGIER
jgi:hypothetical protein